MSRSYKLHSISWSWIWLALVSLNVAFAEGHMHLRDSDVFQYRSACGPIAVFVALRTLGHSVALDEVARGCNWAEGKATSLNDLCAFVNRQPGVRCIGVKMNIEQLKNCAESKGNVVILVVKKNSNAFDHVLCVNSVNEGGFTVLDYPKLLRQCDDSEIMRLWNGDALVVSRDFVDIARSHWYYFSPAMFLMSLFMFSEVRRRYRIAYSPETGRLVTLDDNMRLRQDP